MIASGVSVLALVVLGKRLPVTALNVPALVLVVFALQDRKTSMWRWAVVGTVVTLAANTGRVLSWTSNQSSAFHSHAAAGVADIINMAALALAIVILILDRPSRRGARRLRARPKLKADG
jgi:uncharacterized membrane protein YtjA (UPF0391 family)